ncbi:MAG: hypothetical protein ACRYGP_19925 [Janthinobacterium lividum]
MTRTISAEFETRRDAEVTVEHLVQEYGLDRRAISIVSVADQNSVGTEVAGSDLEDGEPKHDPATHPPLAGRLKVSVEAEAAQDEAVLKAFAAYNGRQV